jgi:ribosomal-protein-alanine N-acetyltransferase
MIGRIKRLFARAEPSIAPAFAGDAASLAVLHAVSFSRGWSEEEFERLLIDRNVVAHRAMIGGKLVGFIVSRIAADEAEILSVAVAAPQRGRGLARRMLDLHLRRLAGLGTNVVFLEVDGDNVPARRLYDRARFREVGRREGYYSRPPGGATALVLRRELA